MEFDQAFEQLIGHEGGYVNDPRDPGGETNWGVSKRSYPAVDIKALTIDGAKAIYRRDFWDRCRAPDLPPALRFDVFDGAVNSGVGQSVKWVQQAIGATADGVLGPLSLAALNERNPAAVAARYNGHRLMFMTELKTWSAFSGGWARRIASNLIGG